MWTEAGRGKADIANDLLPRPLTRREIHALCLVAEGYSNPEIAAHLHISPATAKTHVGRIIAKLRARDRTHAAVKAIRLGIITSD